MDGILIPYAFLRNKDLNTFDSLVLAYILANANDEFVCDKSNTDIINDLNVNAASVPTTIAKLQKLGFVSITSESGTRSLVYTFDAPHRGGRGTWIYIMKDTANDWIKVGYSNNPKYRESTLQSEKPSIELLAKYWGTQDQERAVHRVLDKYRYRGEWFKCTEEIAREAIKRVLGIK